MQKDIDEDNGGYTEEEMHFMAIAEESISDNHIEDLPQVVLLLKELRANVERIQRKPPKAL